MYWTMALLPFALLLLGFPIFLLLLATSFVVMIFFFPVPLTAIHQIIFNSLNKYALLAVPFFIFAGDLMSRGGISTRLLRWVAAIIGGFRGSIPLTSLGFAALFGAISGVTTAATAAIGTLTYPRMREAGYSERFASALITAGGALDNLIPPSIAMIIYGIASDTSIIALFAAGIGPGLLLAGLFADLHLFSFREGRNSGVGTLLGMGTPPGDPQRRLGARRDRYHLRRHLFGVFSPTEAAGVACIYAIIVSYFVYREVTLNELFETAARSMYLTGLIFIIISVAGLYAWLLTISGIAQQAAAFITAMHAEPLDGAADHQRLLAVRRLLPGSGFGAHHADAAAGADRRGDRRQSGPFRCYRSDEPDYRHFPSSIRAQHLRLPGVVQDTVRDALYGTHPVRRARRHCVADGDLYPGYIAVGPEIPAVT